jgi:hypothetical protein
MITNCDPTDRIGAQFSEQVLQMASQNQALFYSVLSAAMVFQKPTREMSEEQSTLHLSIQNRAVSLLSQQMADATTATHEANIWAVFAMGYASDIGPIRSGKFPRQSFPKELQSLHVYGRFQLNQIHLRGLIQLVMLIGGIQNIKTPGMASVISLCAFKVSS